MLLFTSFCVSVCVCLYVCVLYVCWYAYACVSAVKFGRMSKRQRDSLIAEVERHRQQQRLQAGSVGGQTLGPPYCPGKDPCGGSPHLLQPLAYNPFPMDPELQRCGPEVHPYLVCPPGEIQAAVPPYRSSQRRVDRSGLTDSRGEPLFPRDQRRWPQTLTIPNILILTRLAKQLNLD